MDLQRLKEKMELKIAPIKIELRYKAVCQGKQTEDSTTASKNIRAIHIDLDLDNFQYNFKVFIGIYGRLVSGFDNGTKMRLFTYPDLVKSNTAKGKLTKACKR